jgi:hypothetical protein
MPLVNANTLLILRGIENTLDRDLADGDLRAYSATPAVYGPGGQARRDRRRGGLFSVGQDGTALLMQKPWHSRPGCT